VNRLLLLALLAAALAGSLALSSPAAGAATIQPSAAAVGHGYGGSHAGNAALNWAEAHATGHWYAYGGAGPSVYDCSGLIMAAFAHGAGISLPHSTYGIPGNRHVHRIPLSWARRGDILAFGSGHMELDTIWPHVSFGAHHSGTQVGWRGWSGWYQPTAAYRVS
jgi:cell wall-associated NlpC family hydrolase